MVLFIIWHNDNYNRSPGYHLPDLTHSPPWKSYYWHPKQSVFYRINGPPSIHRNYVKKCPLVTEIHGLLAEANYQAAKT